MHRLPKRIQLLLPATLFLMLCLPVRAELQFEEAAADSGLSVEPTASYGISIGDIDGDGWPDIFLNNHALKNAIYVNRGDGTFDNKLDEIDAADYWVGPGAWEDTHGASWIDFDNDGDQDLVIATGECCDPQFMENVDGKLYNRTVEFGMGNNIDRGGRLPIWFDLGGDGVLDVAFATLHATVLLKQEGGVFQSALPDVNFGCGSTQFGVLIDMNGDGTLDVLCVNDGGPIGQAWDVSGTQTTNISGLLPDVSGVNEVITGDFDGDLRNDMMLLTGSLRPSEVVVFDDRRIEAQLINQGRSFSFTAAGALQVRLNWTLLHDKSTNVYIGADAVHPASPIFTLDPADPSVAGQPADAAAPALYIGYDPDEARWTFDIDAGTAWSSAYLQITTDATIGDLVETGVISRDLPQPPVLLLSAGAGFEDGTVAAGLDQDIRCVGGAAGDFDNDMDLDVYLVCRGGVENIPNILLRNEGDGTFQMVAAAGGAEGVTGAAVGDHAGVGDSVGVADLDLDGRLDLVVTNGLNLRPLEETGGPVQLFRNRSDAGIWLQFDLQGSTVPRDAIGTRVLVTAGGVTQLRVQDEGYHRWSQNYRRLHFGLGSNTTADVEVQWPDGSTQAFTGVEGNTLYKVTQGEDPVVIVSRDLPDSGDGGTVEPPPPPPPPPSGGSSDSGSGALGVYVLLALSLAALRRRLPATWCFRRTR